MAFALVVRHDFLKFRDTLTDFQRTQLPFATARALTDCAKLARKAMQGEMRRVFDRPTPFTLNSLRVQPATKRNLQADIHFRDFAAKGTPAGIYLKPQIEGGGRRYKRSERRLVEAGVMAAGRYLLPRSGAQLDAFGNLNRGQLVKILSVVQALGGGANQNGPGRRKRKAERYFATGTPGGRPSNLAPGIYQRVGARGIKPVYGFGRAPQYSQRLDFFGFAEAAYAKAFPALIREALDRAMQTAKRK